MKTRSLSSPSRHQDRLAHGEKLRSRDPEALGELYDEHMERVYGYIRRHVADEGVAEDLTHDVFLHVYRAIPTFDPSKEVRPWLFAIAANRLRDHWRSLPRRMEAAQARIDEEGLPEPAAAEVPAHAGLESGELKDALADAVATLPETLRTALHLRALEGLSFEAIAERVDRNVVAVRKRYSRALGLLRERAGAGLRTHLESA